MYMCAKSTCVIVMPVRGVYLITLPLEWYKYQVLVADSDAEAVKSCDEPRDREITLVGFPLFHSRAALKPSWSG